MNYSDPINNVAYSIAQACLTDLNAIEYEDKRKKPRRPFRNELGHIILFQQAFSDTTCSFGAVGGQAITTADIVIIEGPMGDVCVYINSRLKRKIKKPNEMFWEEVRSFGLRFGNYEKGE